MIYTTELVETLLPGVWDSMRVLTAPNPLRPDPDMPKAPSGDPRRSSDKMAMIADVQRAWRWTELELVERQVLFCTYALEEGGRTTEFLLGLRNGSSSDLKMDGISKMLHFLNGTSPLEPDEDVEMYWE